MGDAAGYVTKCSGEGIYFAAKSGRMAAEAIVEGSAQGKKMVGQGGWGARPKSRLARPRPRLAALRPPPCLPLR